MKPSRWIQVIGACASALVVALIVDAQPSAPLGLRNVATDSTMTGSGRTDNTLKVNTAVIQARVSSSCSAPDAIRAIAADGTVTCTSGTGDVTSVAAGSGLTGGGTSGALTIDVGAGNGITVAADTVSANLGTGLTFSSGAIVPNLAGATCAASEAVTAISAAGAGTCSTVGDITSVVAGTSLTGGATSGAATLNVSLPGASCAASEAITALSAAGTGTCSTVGDITAVTAGTGLSGGASSGAATLTVNIAGASCAASEAVTAIGATGTGTCTTVGDITSVVAGTNLSGGATSGAATVNLATAVDQSAASSSMTVGDFRTSRLTATVSADQTDYGPTGYASSYWWDLTMSGADRSINGIQGGVTGRRVFIRNVSGSLGFGLTLVGNSGSAGNKFKISDSSTGAGNLALREGDGAEFMYDGTSWVQVGQTNGVNTQNASLSATISGDQTDYSPAGYLNSNFWYITPSGAARTIRGIAGGTNNRIIRIFNPPGTQTLVLSGEDGTNPTVTNRLKTADGNNGASATQLAPGTATEFAYSTTNNRWNELDRTQSYNYNVANNITSGGTATIAGQITAGTGNFTTTYHSGPTQLGATTTTLDCAAGQCDNFTPNSFNVSMGTILAPTSVDRTITGLSSGQNNRWVLFWNSSTTLSVTLAHQSGSSTAANRFAMPGAIDYVIKPEQSIWLWYSTNDSRWHAIQTGIRGLLTSNKVTKGSSGYVATDSGISDDGTTITTTEDINVNGGKFTVAGSSGNTVIAGTGTITGNAKLGAGVQIVSGGTPTADHGTVATGSTDYSGSITSIGVNTAVVLTYSAAFPNRSRCMATTNSVSVALEAIVVTSQGASSATFTCYNILTAVAANCDDFTYECVGQ